MADENTDITKLQAALQAERDAHKATKAQYLAPIRTALGLGEDANLDTITATLGTRLGDADKIVADRTASLTAERDAAVAERDKISGERNAEKIDAAISAALSKSGIIAQNTEDATLILRGVLEVNKDGRVVTKAAPNVVPGQSAEQFVMGQLKTMRTHYWPGNTSGGARGGSHSAPSGLDVSAFRTGNVTKMMAAIAAHGERAIMDACRRQGIAVPSWIGGGR